MPPESPKPDRYAVVGHPISHSRSPLIHRLFAEQTGQNLTYETIDAAPDAFEKTVRDFAAAGGRGLNVTIPHKEAAYALCGSHGPEAETARAVNTISIEDGELHGDNTDGRGFLRDLEVNHAVTIGAQRVLLLGAGGAARGIVRPLLLGKPACLVIANRTLARAESLKDELGSPRNVSVHAFSDLDELGRFDIVINATSAGLDGDIPPFPASLLDRDTFCYDLVYSARPTPFVRWARSGGAGRAIQGWGMLVEQAAESFAIWRGIRPDTAPILAKLEDLTA